MNVEAYIDSLPRGLDSYPRAECKASVARIFLAGFDRDRLATAVPASLHATLFNLPPDSVWMPEVHGQVFYLALRQVFYTEDKDYLAMTLQKNTELLRSPLYRMLFKLLSPQRIAKNAGVAWGRFHRGSRFTCVKADDDEAVFDFGYPPFLYSRLSLHAFATAALSGIQVGGRENAYIDGVTYSPEAAQVVIRYL